MSGCESSRIYIGFISDGPVVRSDSGFGNPSGSTKTLRQLAEHSTQEPEVNNHPGVIRRRVPYRASQVYHFSRTQPARSRTNHHARLSMDDGLISYLVTLLHFADERRPSLSEDLSDSTTTTSSAGTIHVSRFVYRLLPAISQMLPPFLYFLPTP